MLPKSQRPAIELENYQKFNSFTNPNDDCKGWSVNECISFEK